MTDATSGVRYGEVTTAVRDSSAANGTPITMQDVMVSRAAPLMLSASDVMQVTLDLIAKMQEGDNLAEDSLTKALDSSRQQDSTPYPDLEVDGQRRAATLSSYLLY